MQPLHPMKKYQLRGFTFIELIILIVIIGVLAAAAIAKYISLSKDAEQASFKAVLGSLRSGLAIYVTNQLATGQPVAAHNPFDDLGNTPSNYAGSFGDVDVGNCGPGQWAYQSGQPSNGNWKVLAYRPKERISSGFSWAGEYWILLAVNEVKNAQGAVIGLSLDALPSYPYQW